MKAFNGARYELAVAADLMRQNFEVFRNVAPVGKVDLVAMKDATMLRVQVKSSFCRRALSGNDVLAVYNNGTVKYFSRDVGHRKLFEALSILEQRTKMRLRLRPCRTLGCPNYTDSISGCWECRGETQPSTTLPLF